VAFSRARNGVKPTPTPLAGCAPGKSEFLPTILLSSLLEFRQVKKEQPHVHHDVSNLMEAGVDFEAVDFPQANRPRGYAKLQAGR
jgi:hypothetical protein